MRVKICGIMNPEDAVFAESVGADAIGVVMSEESKRCVAPERAEEIFSSVGPFVTTVIVLHTETQEFVDEIATIKPSAIQFSGDIKKPKNYTGKMICVAGENGEITDDCDAVIIDQSQGKNIPFNPDYAKKIIGRYSKPVILAGGLNPSNVSSAIAELRPYAVDVCSGIEKSPGVKDRMLILDFLRAAGKVPVVRKKNSINR